MSEKACTTMGKTKAFRWFNEMQVWDQARFLDYLQSDYFQTRSSVLDTTKELLKILDQPNLSKTEFFGMVVPTEQYTPAKFNERLNYVMEAMKHFVAVDHVVREMDQKPDLKRVNYFRGLQDLSRNTPLRSRKLMWKEYLLQYKKLGERLRTSHQSDLLANVEYHFCETYLDSNSRTSTTKGKKNQHEPEELIARKMASADKAYYVERMRECAILMNRRLRKPFPYSPSWKTQVDRVKNMLEGNPETIGILEDPQVRFYQEFLNAMQMVLEASPEDAEKVWFDPNRVKALCQIASQNPAIFEEDSHAYGLYANELTHFANLGHDEFNQLYFELNFHLLQNGKILDSNRKVPAITFRNTVLLGYRLGGKYESASEYLIKNLRNDLSFVYKERADLLGLCVAWKFFYRKDYPKACRRCAEFDFQDPLLQMQVTDLMFRAAISSEISPKSGVSLELDFLEPLKELKQLLARHRSTQYGIVRMVSGKMPLYDILVQMVSEKVSRVDGDARRVKFDALLVEAKLPGHERAWLQETVDKIA